MGAWRLIAGLALAVCLAGARAHAQPPAEPAPLLSPRLIALRDRLAQGDRTALASFWQAVGAEGAPLVERIAGSDRDAYVTFVWRDPGDTRNVVIRFNGTPSFANPAYFRLSQMARLDGTDLWYRTYRFRDDARFPYQLSPNDALTLLPGLSADQARARLATVRPDPLNPRRWDDRDGPASLVELPNAPAQPWIAERPVPHGRVSEVAFESIVLGNSRRLTIYTPPGYRRGTRLPLLVALDGETYAGVMRLPVILDNLIATGAIPPLLAVMVGNADGARLRELSYDPRFNRFLAEELVPWARRTHGVSPARRDMIIAGASLSGGAALLAAIEHPALFGGAISQSGGYMYREQPQAPFTLQPGELFEGGFPQSEWLARRLASAQGPAPRLYVEAGTFEDIAYESGQPRFAYPALLLGARHLRDVIEARGHPFCYHEYNGAHEPLNWRGSFADALVFALGRPALPGSPCAAARQAANR